MGVQVYKKISPKKLKKVDKVRVIAPSIVLIKGIGMNEVNFEAIKRL